MKQKLTMITMITILLFGSVFYGTCTAGTFLVTAKAYAHTDDLNTRIKAEFGDNYRLADWNDIIREYNNGMKPDQILGNSSTAAHAFCSRSGKQFYSSSRHYFASRNNHHPHSGYLVHASIDNNLFSLGSWYGKYKILAYTETSNTETISYYLPVYKPSPGHWAGLGITNLNAKAKANFTVKIYNQAGRELAEEAFNLQAHGQSATIIGLMSHENGWVKISSNQPLAGMGLLGEYITNTNKSYMADIPFVNKLSKKLIIPHVAYNNCWDTILYLANPNTSMANVTLTYTNNKGIDSNSHRTSIPANGSKQISVSTIAKSINVKKGFVTISSSQGLAAFALYNNLKSGGLSYAGINAVDIATTSSTPGHVDVTGTWNYKAKYSGCNNYAVGKFIITNSSYRYSGQDWHHNCHITNGYNESGALKVSTKETKAGFQAAVQKVYNNIYGSGACTIRITNFSSSLINLEYLDNRDGSLEIMTLSRGYTPPF